MGLKKITTSLLFSTLLAFGLSIEAFSQENGFKDDYETKIDEIEKKDLGIYVLGRISDIENNNLEDVEIKSSLEKVTTNKNGEYFIKVEGNDKLIINKKGYKELEIKITDLKSKIKLDKVPVYLPLIPNVFGGIKYSNQGFNESIKDIMVSGRFNDGLNINLSGKFFDSILLNLDYERYSAQIKRKNNEKDFVDTSTNNISLSGGYVLNLLEDRLDLSLSIKTFFNNFAINNKSTLKEEEINRFDDYLDYGYSRSGAGLDLSAFVRPVRYVPFTLQTSFSYYPFIKVDQKDSETKLPDSMNRYSILLRGRYDLNKFVLYGDLNYDSYFSTGYSSSMSGVSTGIGYAF